MRSEFNVIYYLAAPTFLINCIVSVGNKVKVMLTFFFFLLCVMFSF